MLLDRQVHSTGQLATANFQRRVSPIADERAVTNGEELLALTLARNAAI
jgi:hypothetical protein